MTRNEDDRKHASARRRKNASVGPSRDDRPDRVEPPGYLCGYPHRRDSGKVPDKGADPKDARNEYPLMPTQYPKGHGARWTSAKTRAGPLNVPGWVDISNLLGATKRRMTEGYLNTRMNRMNTIETNQNYVTKVMENPRTPEYNRQVVLRYVRDHPDKFTPFPDIPEDPDYQDWAERRNGNARRGFIREFLRRYEM